MMDWAQLQELLADTRVRLGVAAIAGLVVGFWLGRLTGRLRRREVDRLAQALFDASEDRHRMATEAMLDRVRASVGQSSLEALAQTSARLLDVADARLASERDRQAAVLDRQKGLIDQEVERIGSELERLRTLLAGLERERARGQGTLTERLDASSRATADLARTTRLLHEALRHAPRRGQWGERLAEDLLRQAGLVEGVSYVRQAALDGGGRPDFTFLLPNGLRLHMDVKFPLDNYLRLVAAEDDAERSRHERAFLQDVRARVKELAARGYQSEQGALDYVLLFIPNEPLAGFIFERRPELVDEALALRVVPCAPASLFAVLAIVRHAVEQFVLNEAADGLVRQMRSFRSEWETFKRELGRLGQRLEEARLAYEALSGPRVRGLERPLARLDDVTAWRGGSDAGVGEVSRERAGDG